MIIFGSYFILMVYVMGMAAYNISDTDKDTFFKTILDLHNKTRDKHNADRLSWNTDIVPEANDLLKIVNSTTSISSNPTYGINTYYEKFDDNFKLDAENVFYSWYNKKIHYDYDDPKPTKDTDLFTQIVWKTTKFLSFALFVGKDHYKLIALYFPRGNNQMEYNNNVERPTYDKLPFNPLNN